MQSNIALTAILKIYTFVLFLGFLLHVLLQCVESQGAGQVFKLMQNCAYPKITPNTVSERLSGLTVSVTLDDFYMFNYIF